MFQAESSDEEDEEDEAPTRCIFFFFFLIFYIFEKNQQGFLFPWNIICSGIPNQNFLITLIFRHRLEWDNDL